MGDWRVVISSIRFYRWISAAVIAAMAVSTAVLVGALVVGDSVRYSLGRMVDVRLGKVNSVMIGGDKFFTEGLAEKISAEAAAVVMLRGTAANDDGTKRINKVSVLGVDERFFEIGGTKSVYDIQEGQALRPGSGQALRPGSLLRQGYGGQAVVNEVAARRLGVSAGDEVLVRVGKPSLMPRDIVLVPSSDTSMAFRVKVIAIAGEDDFGMFGLSAEQSLTPNVFVSRQWLAEKIGQSGRANLLLAAGDKQQVQEAVQRAMSLADVGLEVSSGDGFVEVKSERVFISDELSESLRLEGCGQVRGVFGYFVNEIKCGRKKCPYSMVTGLEARESIKTGEIIITDWLAEDIGAKVGDEIELAYFVPTGSQLGAESSKFTVSKIVAQRKDESYTPKFPGLVDQENCRDWEPGVPIDLGLIRDKDEEFWDEYGASPKAFISLADAQRIWANRFGKLTAVRYVGTDKSVGEIEAAILARIDAGKAGLNFEDVRQRGIDASKQGTDFGGLFVGLSMFLIVAAVVLMRLVFVFGVERRIEQAGIMAAMGFSRGRITRVFMLEGGVLAFVGMLIGCAGGLVYTKVMIWCLSTVWAGAMAGSNIHFHANPGTVAMGAMISFVIAMVAIFFSVRGHLKSQATELLSGIKQTMGKVTAKWKLIALVLSGAVFVMWAVWMVIGGRDDSDNAEVFFSAGGMLLVGGLLIAAAVLKGIGAGVFVNVNSLGKVAARNSVRRSGRSLAVIIMLALGSFLVVSVGANRKDVTSNANERSSGTGGFALIAESAMPIVEPITYPGAKVVRMRVKDGDDASCLNLNRAQKPTLVGVNFEEFNERGSFTSKMYSFTYPDEGVVSAVGDQATVVWGLGKSTGDEIEYVDEKGNTFKLEIVRMINNSVLQGKLIISEEDFVEKFPSEEGYRLFLIDVEPGEVEEVSAGLANEYRDYGLQVQRTVDKLRQFGEVENTYLSIFQVLGGLAMMIGSVGLGLVVLLNVLDRRGELAMMRATGFDKGAILRMIMLEHAGLLAAGLIIGVVSAIIAVWPALISAGAGVPYVSLGMTVGAIVVSGVVWIWAAGRFAMRGDLIDSLRLE